ncbi:hypothetical protein OV090_09905 [Nannocystis sp. RBIL2]|uniref:hypothetical protein n=1 Tax=Nannocystis sp. RBIL2 TaxID=2996788 RepID=UPI0022710ED7|nr:hypothetical protein [Nannocystis sp. RBIL2]MCY1065075.1 hypothetical protein [Nannocystis sp. RBIL2]
MAIQGNASGVSQVRPQWNTNHRPTGAAQGTSPRGTDNKAHGALAVSAALSAVDIAPEVDEAHLRNPSQ